MGLLDDLLYNASPDNGSGLLGYLNSGRTAHVSDDTKSTSADDLAAALGLNNIDQAAKQDNAMNPQLGPAPSVPISQPNMPAAPAPAPLASPVTAPRFGAGGSPYLFPQSGALFGGNLPAPAAPTSPLNANAQAPAATAPGDDDEEDAPAAPVPAQASPIAVGNTMMPRIGPAASFTPAPAAPAPAPVAPAAPVSPLAPVQSFLNRAADGLQSISRGGSLTGAIRGQFDDPTSKAAQTANVTARALIARGVDPQMAIAAVQPGNKEALDALMKQAFTQGSHTQETDKDGNVWDINELTGQKTVALAAKDDKFQNVNTKNTDGSETHQAFNTKTGEYLTPAGAASPKGAIDPNLTGKDRLDAIMAVNPDYGRKIQAMVNGDVPLPSMGQASRSPMAQKMIEDVLAVDGSTSASDFATRAATRKDYASGVASRVTKSLNTTIEHAQRLDAAIDKLNNHTYFPGVTNWLHDKIDSNTNPEYQKAKSDFESAKEAFIKELDFTLSGGHSSVSGSAELRDKINRADSPEALHAAIQTDLHLLAARLDSHTTGFNQGTKSQRDPQDFLYPKNRAAFNKLMGSTDTSTGQPVPGVEATPAQSAAPAASAAPLKVGQSAKIGDISIKRVN